MTILFVERKQARTKKCSVTFSLNLHEYQIDFIARKCEARMVSMIKTRKERDVLAILKTLISTCIDEARHLTLRQLKQYPMRNQIENDNYLQITEGIIERNESGT